jgi:hypothetical protein
MIASAVFTVTQKKPVYSVVGLLLNFIALAITYLTLHAEFLAVIQIVVYSGAILMLFVFVIALLSSGTKPFDVGPNRMPRVLIRPPSSALDRLRGLVGTFKARVRAASHDRRRDRRCERVRFGRRFRHRALHAQLAAVRSHGVRADGRDHRRGAARRRRRRRSARGRNEAARREPIKPADREGRSRDERERSNYVHRLSAILFFIGVVGVIARRNPLIQLMSIELMFNAANLALVTFARVGQQRRPHLRIPRDHGRRRGGRHRPRDRRDRLPQNHLRRRRRSRDAQRMIVEEYPLLLAIWLACRSRAPSRSGRSGRSSRRGAGPIGSALVRRLVRRGAALVERCDGDQQFHGRARIRRSSRGFRNSRSACSWTRSRCSGR